MNESAAGFVRANAFAISFAAYVAGVIIANDDRIGLRIAAACTCMLVMGCGASRHGTARLLAWSMAGGYALGFASACAALHADASSPLGALAEHHVAVRGIVTERPHAAGSGLSARVRIVEVDAPATRAAMSLRGALVLLDFPLRKHPDTLAGRELIVRARFSLPSGSRNDGEPAQKDILADQSVVGILAAPAPSDVRIGAAASGWEAWWARLRTGCARSLETRLPPLDATVLEGILWGDRGDLPSALRQEFADTGTVHVLTTAGLHLGIFAALVAWLLSRLPLARLPRVCIVVASAWGYAALAGLHLPTIRAATMLTAGTIAHESGRGRTPSAVIAAAAFAVALPHPLVVLSASFSMSFACVCGIALIVPALERCGMCDATRSGRLIVELARTGLAVQLAMWPLQALYFNAFTPWAVLANMAVVPLVGVVMAFGGALVVASAALPVLATPLTNLAGWSTSLLIGIVERFASLPHAHIDVPPPTHVFLVVYWIALAAWAWATAAPDRWRRYSKWTPAAIASLVAIYAAPGAAAALDPRLHVDAIDVGQADCILIRAPGMHAMLVDGGGKLERSGPAGTVVAQPLGDVIAERTVLPFLLRHWVLHLDAVVLTHPHGDHAGGLPVILARERVGVLYDSAQLYGGPAYQRALDVVRERHLRYRVARRGESFDLGRSTHVSILAPEMPLITGTSSDINNNSVVLRVTFGYTRVLLTGDAQAEAEGRLLSHGGSDLAADILKVGHHGSAYSSTPAFLAAVHPKVAIISCGLHNMFGHPSPRTVAALQAAGASVYRTDLDGGVSATIDPSSTVISVVRNGPSRGPRM